MFKKIMISTAAAGLMLVSSIGLRASEKAGPVYEVEIWNKRYPGNPWHMTGIWIYTSDLASDDKQVGIKDFEYIHPNAGFTMESARDLVVYIPKFIISRGHIKPLEGSIVRRYTFTPEKTVYVRVDKLGILGPQTGPYRGWTGKTKRGHSLGNNVKKDDVHVEEITLYGPGGTAGFKSRRPQREAMYLSLLSKSLHGKLSANQYSWLDSISSIIRRDIGDNKFSELEKSGFAKYHQEIKQRQQK